jgi:hypothetical protein
MLKHFLSGAVPLCKCGCGKEVEWHSAGCKFRDYINGHNEGGFKGYVSNPEQIKYRNERIREAYENDRLSGGVIRKKISKSVREAFKDPTKIMNLRNGQLASWNDDRRMEASARFRKMWKNDRERLMRIIFTEEFGRKISESNMKRGISRDSNEETLFGNHLEKIFGRDDIHRSAWINHEEKRMCVDFYIRSKRAYVEWDGTYWHGLDRDEGFTNGQIHNVMNDAVKNQLATDLGKTYIRVPGYIDVESIVSYDTLIEKSHVVVEGGNIVKDMHDVVNKPTFIAAVEKLVFQENINEIAKCAFVDVCIDGLTATFENEKLIVDLKSLLIENDDEMDSEIRRDACVKKGYKYMLFFSDEWSEKNKICRSMVMNKLGKTQTVYARECDVVELNGSTAMAFFHENHLEGGVPASCYLALRHPEMGIVMVASARRPNKGHENEWELARLASKLRLIVVGGASRLVPRLVEIARQNGKSGLISYADRRLGDGSVYEKIGMIRERPQRYARMWYTDGQKRRHRLEYNDKRKNEQNLSEEDYASSNGLRKIFGCRNNVFRFNIDQNICRDECGVLIEDDKK